MERNLLNELFVQFSLLPYLRKLGFSFSFRIDTSICHTHHLGDPTYVCFAPPPPRADLDRCGGDWLVRKQTKNRIETTTSTIENPTPFPPIILGPLAQNRSNVPYSPFPNIEDLSVCYTQSVRCRSASRHFHHNTVKLRASQTLRFSDFFIDSFFKKTRTLQFISFYGGQFILFSLSFSRTF